MSQMRLRSAGSPPLSFQLTNRKALGQALRAALAHDLAAAVAMLGDRDLPLERRVHKVRRKLKRDRSLLRVFAPAVPELAGAIRLKLRDAGRELAGLREAHALAAAAADLGRELDARGSAALKAAVAMPDVDEGSESAAIARAASLIGDAAALVAFLPTAKGRRRFNAALAEAHDRSRRLRRKAERSGRTADLHDWRKALKDLVHLTLLGNGLLRHGKGVVSRARAAEERLGDDHDLAILRERLVKGGRTAAARFVSNVEIGDRRNSLQRRAFRLGRQIDRAKTPVLR